MRNANFPTFLLFAVLTSAAVAQPSENEAKLLGAWAESRINSTANLNPQELEEEMKASLLRGVVVYNPDHTFVVYLCGPIRLKMSELRMESPHGTWEIREPDLLVLHTAVGSKSSRMEERIRWDRDQLVVSNGLHRLVKYPGELPPSC
jgi:hypothetical protein